jgi:hypothetical protein
LGGFAALREIAGFFNTGVKTTCSNATEIVEAKAVLIFLAYWLMGVYAIFVSIWIWLVFAAALIFAYRLMRFFVVFASM